MITPSKTEIQHYKLPESFDLTTINQIDLTALSEYFGYTENKKKSTPNNRFFESEKDQTKIIIKNNHYFNPNDNLDKGSVYSFILNRLNGFLQINDYPTGFDKRTAFVIAAQFLNVYSAEKIDFSKKTPEKNTSEEIKIDIKTIQENLNIKPLFKRAFLLNRGLTLGTINDPKFRDNIFNSLVEGSNPGSFIPNVAFPLYNPSTGAVSGYEIRNNDFKKIVGNNLHLWHSAVSDKNDCIVYGESAIDCISHYQLNKENYKNALYYSFSGNIYKEKLDSFITQLKPLIDNGKTLPIVSITDNDLKGIEYDYLILTTLCNLNNKTNYIEYNHTNKEHQFNIIYLDKDNQDLKFIVNDKWMQFKNDFSFDIKSNNISDAQVHPSPLKDRIQIVIPENENFPHHKVLDILKSNFLSSNFQFTTHKVTKGLDIKDWNDILKNQHVEKKNNNLKL